MGKAGNQRERRVAEALLRKMKETDGAMVVGPLIDGRTGLDGRFDILELARAAITATRAA